MQTFEDMTLFCFGRDWERNIKIRRKTRLKKKEERSSNADVKHTVTRIHTHQPLPPHWIMTIRLDGTFSVSSAKNAYWRRCIWREEKSGSEPCYTAASLQSDVKITLPSRWPREPAANSQVYDGLSRLAFSHVRSWLVGFMHVSHKDRCSHQFLPF